MAMVLHRPHELTGHSQKWFQSVLFDPRGKFLNASLQAPMASFMASERRRDQRNESSRRDLRDHETAARW
jgi:hypothetical protein